MVKQKVFCIGFMKTGTTTLNRALTILGYQVSHNSWRWLNYIVKEDWTNLAQQVAHWDALEDNPIPLIYKELDQAFPGSKFILSVRDEDAWYQSVSYHIGNLPSPMHAWLFGKGKSLPKNDKAHTIEVFSKHQTAVKAYFKDRPKDLLILDVTKTEDWHSLCAFLNIDQPATPFPHANRSAFSSAKHSGIAAKLKYWKKRTINPLKLWWMYEKGYLPTPQQRLRTL